MGWKIVLGYATAIFLTLLIFFYWIFPISTIDFGSISSKNSNFSLNSSATQAMQFYPNMRYAEKQISYKIEDSCSLQKTDDMERAFRTLDNLTIIDFYPAASISNAEIRVDCSDKSNACQDSGHYDPNTAGCGGPSNITKTDNFNVIHNGDITLIKHINCERPNVAIHELLHALGFDHSENSNNIMYPVSKCSQTIGQDTVDELNRLYSYPSLPDLSFDNVSANMNSRYLDVEMIIRNQGLAESPEAKVEIYADGKLIKDFDVSSLPIGTGSKINLNNIFIFQKRVDELDFVIKTDFEELEKTNNEVKLNYQA